ncbi:MAG: polysaccharide biosynthesis C-terminal domain-containing protein [bacterium]|nr:polysaccharide biosynthesis C-terminal domain-containing protein [bacterium]
MNMRRDLPNWTSGEVTRPIDEIKSYVLSVGEAAVDIGVSLFLLVMIGRSYGPGGLGVYTFLLSAFVIVSFLVEFGVGKYAERELAVGGGKDVDGLLARTKGVILISGLMGGLGTLVLGKWIVGASVVGSGAWPGFCVLAVAVPFNLYSGFQASVLHGRGDHVTASRAGVVKRLVLLGSVFLLTGTGIRPDLLVTAFVFSEIAHILLVKRAVRMPSLTAALARLGTARATIRESLRYYFTHEGLRVLFFVDFFILGFFVSAVQEGSYAEASVLARFFLIIPLGAAPLYRVRVYLSTGNDHMKLFADSRRTAARFFSFHAVIALTFLLYFPYLLRAVFRVQGDLPISFKIFSLLLPGLLLFSSTVVLEPLFNIDGRKQGLNRIALKVFLINAFLNFYLIPFAGVFGAAIATTLSLVIYFFLFAHGIGGKGEIPIKAYLLSGTLIYVAYHILDPARMPALLVIPLIAVVMPLLFGVLGLYSQNVERRM